MPAINLIGQNFPGRRLNEVVFPGAHDAGTSSEDLGKNVRTQSYDLYNQAIRGCRYFDVRVGFRKIGSGQNATIVGTTFHATSLTSKPTKHAHGPLPIGTIKSKIGPGGWGDTLNKILTHARTFVQRYGTEFLILRFSKSADYPRIARECIAALGANHLTGYKNVNLQRLNQLAGKVVTVFASDSWPELRGQFDHRHGIYKVYELLDKDTNTSKGYDGSRPGLQYFGGHSNTSSVGTNTSKQMARMKAAVNEDALGMMYWTLTGFSPISGIRNRNEQLWTASVKADLKKAWQCGMEDAMYQRMGRRARGENINWDAKMFMPNIVMMDFVNTEKCNTVYNLNTVASQEIAAMVQHAKLIGATYN